MLNCHILLFFSNLRINENSRFVDRVGMGMGSVFSFLRKKVKDVVFNMMENNSEFAFGNPHQQCIPLHSLI
jgi:hypothetical protein